MIEIKFKAWDKIDKKMRIVTRITFGLEATGHTPIIVHLDDGKDPVTRSIEDVDLLQFMGRRGYVQQQPEIKKYVKDKALRIYELGYRKHFRIEEIEDIITQVIRDVRGEKESQKEIYKPVK